jgi:phosphate transport system substrate-binding protein
MNSKKLFFGLLLLLASTAAFSQTAKRQVVIVTGVRFAYPLVQKWIDDYNQVNPDVQIIIEARGSADPGKYDILIEAYEQDEAVRKTREYAYVARYAVVPVANSKSEFAKVYGAKGLNAQIVKQLFFEDIFADAEKAEKINAPFTAYTRLQKAGAPSVFANTYGFEQKDIKGKAIAGSDEHLLKSILRDSTAISYLPISLVYDLNARKPLEGITVLPVDLNDNGKVADDEKITAELDKVIEKIETGSAKDIKGLAVGYLHLSVPREGASEEAVDFIRYVIDNGSSSLHQFGYVLPEDSKVDKSKFKPLATIKR